MTVSIEYTGGAKNSEGSSSRIRVRWLKQATYYTSLYDLFVYRLRSPRWIHYNRTGTCRFLDQLLQECRARGDHHGAL